jgi:DNA-binding winged helix-turn-helix (wHTH) protein/dipeptidyl aminopeptidase/acylaminoacyl peptidase
LAAHRGETVGFGAFEIDLGTGEVRRHGIKVKLQDQSFAVLALLLERPGELVTREDFRARIWGDETYVDFDQGLNKAIKNIRAALGDSAEQPKYVETLPKRGYRFIAPLNSSQHLGAGSNQVSTVQSAQDADLSLPGQPGNVSGEAPKRTSVRRGTWHTRTAAIGAALAAGLALLFFLTRHNWERDRELRLRQLTTNNAENFIQNSVVSPDGRYLLYGDQIGIHLRVIATGETHTFEKPKALSGEDSWYPTAWYPDQMHFAAVSETLTSRGVIPTSWNVSILGDGATKLRERAIARSISPDGSLVAFTSDNLQEIGIMGAGGEDATIVSKGDDSTAFELVQWSPDGRRLFDLRTQWVPGGNNEISIQYVLESRRPRGGAAIPIASHVFGSASGFPDWRGGGSFCVPEAGRVVYTRSVSAESLAGDDDTNLWEVRIKPETGEPQGASRPLTKWVGYHLDHLSVSRDGKTLVLQKSNWQLHTYVGEIGTAGRLQPLRRMTLEDSDDLPWAWTPDSTAVLFTSNRTGPYRLYKQASDGQLAESITTGPGVIDQARLSPDGKWIIYSVEAPNGRSPRLMRVAMSGGAPHLIMETRLIAQIGCPIAPATRCITLEEATPQVFKSFDPINGNARELFKLSFWNGGWEVSPTGSIGILRQDAAGGRVQILSQTGSLEHEINLAPWSNFSGFNWSADPREMYTASVGPSGATILRVNASGEIQPLWLLKGSPLAWAIAAPDGHHLAILGKSSYSNASIVENF